MSSTSNKIDAFVPQKFSVSASYFPDLKLSYHAPKAREIQ